MSDCMQFLVWRYFNFNRIRNIEIISSLAIGHKTVWTSKGLILAFFTTINISLHLFLVGFNKTVAYSISNYIFKVLYKGWFWLEHFNIYYTHNYNLVHRSINLALIRYFTKEKNNFRHNCCPECSLRLFVLGRASRGGLCSGGAAQRTPDLFQNL